MSRSRIVRTLTLGTLMLGLPAAAQDRPAGPFKALEALNASYEKQLHDLECRRIADLAALAEKASGPEADAAYRQLFGLAMAQGLCTESRGAAARCLDSASCGRDTRALAALVQVLGRTDKGEHDRALAGLEGAAERARERRGVGGPRRRRAGAGRRRVVPPPPDPRRPLRRRPQAVRPGLRGRARPPR